MAEAKQLVFKYGEVVEALLKQSDIHEGLWVLSIQLGLGAASIGPSDEELKPAAIVTLNSIGISRADKATNLTVDASVVNPAPAPKATTRRKAKWV